MEAIIAPTKTHYPKGATKWILIFTAISCAIMELIDTTVVNVSLREISGNIGATTTEIAWVITAYAISNVIIIPLASMLSDFFGRKMYFTISVIIFTFSSLMCGLSTNLWMLVFWRFVQGIGGGGLFSTAQSIIVGAFPPEKLSTANAIFGMGIIVGPTFGPSIGGYITDHLSWHWIFFVNIPIGIVATFLSWFYVTDMEGTQKQKKIDWWGILFLIMALGFLQYVLEEGVAEDWLQSSKIIAFSIVATVGLVAFIYRELNIDYPAVNIKLYKNYNLVMASIMNFMLGFLLFGTVFLFPLFAQISLGWTATQTGAFMIPSALFAVIGMPIVGKLLASGKNPKTIIFIGIVLNFIFLMMMSFSSPDSNQNTLYFPYILRGIGLAFMISPILSLAVFGLQDKDVAQAIGLTNMIRQLGGAVGIALINIFLTRKNAEIRGSMLGYITDYTNASTERFSILTQNFISKGYSQGDAETLAYKTMEWFVLKQQTLLSYNQGFYAMGIIMIVSLPVVVFIRYKKEVKK